MQPGVQRPYSEIVWHQSEMLEPNPDAAQLSRFQSTFAYLLAQSENATSAFPKRSLSASHAEEMGRLDAAKAAVTKGIADPPEIEEPLPTAIALWPLNSEGKASGNLPEGSGWVGTSSPKFKFRDRSGVGLLGYFERTDERQAGEPRIISVFVDDAPVPSNPRPVFAGICALVGLAFFVLAMGGAMKTGSTIADARLIVATAETNIDNTFIKAIDNLCSKQTTLCGGQKAPEIVRTCAPLIAPASLAADAKIELPSLCAETWNAALRAVDEIAVDAGFLDATIEWIIGAFTFLHRTGSEIAKSNVVSVVPFFFVSMFGLIALFVGLGFWTSGHIAGIAINAQNRVSLSLIQVTAWTVVILAAYATYCAFNVGAMGARFNEVGGAESLFPKLEGWIWGVIGITIASPIASALIKGAKPKDTTKSKGNETESANLLNVKLDPLSKNLSTSQASLADIFLGEDKSNFTRLDISRAQNVVITALLLFTFTGWLVHLLGGVAMPTVLIAFVGSTPILSKFPEPGATFTALLALTHGAYLAGKWKPAN